MYYSVFEAAAGLTLPRVAASQSQEGEAIDKENSSERDLIFFTEKNFSRRNCRKCN
ncbi:hypothetical protein [Chryseobacterium indoltheticum]|uniref:hypothetical protein n=1 Tax=Chryseobacterium indoltheticum TaxID=254 RepID=UPI003F49216E